MELFPKFSEWGFDTVEIAAQERWKPDAGLLKLHWKSITCAVYPYVRHARKGLKFLRDSLLENAYRFFYLFN
jgi:hypothetical protein